MTMKNKKFDDYEVEFRKETWEGLLIFDGDSEVWLPKSALKGFQEHIYAKGDVITIAVPDWLAEEKCLC